MQVKTLKRSLSFTATWAAGVLTVNTTGNHYLASTNTVDLVNATGDKLVDVAVTVTSGTQFTVATTESTAYLAGTVVIPYFSTGMTGVQAAESFARSLAVSSVVQSYVTGTGGASYTVNGSLDGVHWSAIGSAVTHAGTTNDTQSVAIEPGWMYITINISSIGAGTQLTVMHSA